MSITRISDNQIQDATSAIIDALTFLNNDSVLKLPVGDSSESDRPASPAIGMLRFNTDEDRPEVYIGRARNSQPGWKNVGNFGGGLGDYVLIRGNSKTIDEDIEIPSPSTGDYTYENAFTVGPVITISSPYIVTVPDGVRWEILDVISTSSDAAIVGDSWTNVGSGDGLGDYNLIRGNSATISEDITLPDPSTGDYSFENAFTVGNEITIASTYTVTIPEGTRWLIYY